MAKIKGKGTVFALSITGTYTAIPNLIDLSISGEKAETYDSTVLGGGAYKTKDPTGYSETATITANAFYDPSDSVFVAWNALIVTPAANNVRVTYTDSTPTAAVYSGVGFGIDKNVVANDGTKCTLTCETSGAPS